MNKKFNKLISDEIEKLLNVSIKKEHQSVMIYYGMAAYLKVSKLEYGGKLFDKYASEELSHAEKLNKYIDDRNGKPAIMQIPEAPNSYSSLEELLWTIYNHEVDVEKNYMVISNVALKEGDHTTYNFISWYLNEQVEEIRKIRRLLEAYMNINKSEDMMLLMNDVFSKEYYSGPSTSIN